MKHQDLVGAFAVHPFAYVGSTDPASDPDNFVTANKAWIDTSVAPALKIRNSGNTDWITVIGSGESVASVFVDLDYIYEAENFSENEAPSQFVLLTHI